MNNIEINYKHITYDNNHNVKKLVDMVTSNLNFLDLISELYFFRKNLDKDNVPLHDKIKLLKGILNRFVLLKKITKSEGDYFVNLCTKLKTKDISDLLEQIVFIIGPFEDINQYNNLGKSMSVKINFTELDTDFDVVFFDKLDDCDYKLGNNVFAGGIIEYHECKSDICTFIPENPARENKRYKTKMDLFIKTYESRPNDRFFIPTFHRKPNAQRKYLQEHNNGKYNFIKIVDVNELKSLALSRLQPN